MMAAVVFESTGPDPSDSAGRLVQKFVTDRTGVLAGSYLLIAGVGLYLVFVAILRGELRRAEEDPGTLSMLWFGGGVASFVSTTLYVAIYAALAHGAAGGDPHLTLALFRISNGVDAAGGVFIAVAVIAAAVVVIQTGVFPRWLGWLGLGAGSLGILGTFALDEPSSLVGTVGFIGTLLTIVWTLLISVVLLRRGVTRATRSQGK